MSNFSSRSGLVAVVLTVAEVMASCSGDVSNGAGSGLPPGCESVLGHASGTPPCEPDPARCDELQRNPKDEYEFSIAFIPNADPKATNCLADFLKSRGAEATVQSWGGMSVTGSFEAIQPALGYEIVAWYLVLTCAGGCTRCSALSVEQCGQDAFCAVIKAKRFDPTNVCMEGTMAIGCMEAPNGCIPEGTAIIDPQRACWATPCGGLPEGWIAAGTQTCPGAALGTRACP